MTGSTRHSRARVCVYSVERHETGGVEAHADGTCTGCSCVRPGSVDAVGQGVLDGLAGPEHAADGDGFDGLAGQVG